MKNNVNKIDNWWLKELKERERIKIWDSGTSMNPTEWWDYLSDKEKIGIYEKYNN